ncbi:MAG: ABC transporter permease [Saprospiraceae bacterium]|nr:ABC transporter permease [Saprospiraceae bacterium]
MILKLIWRNLWRNSRRTIITTASITFAVLFSILMQSFQTGAFDNLIQNVVGYYSGYVQIHKNGYWNDRILENGFYWEDSLTQIIQQHANISGIVPRLETFVLASNGSHTKGCMLVGTDPEKENKLSQLKNKLISGNYFSETEESILIAEGLATRFEIHSGDTLVLFGQGYQGTIAAGKYKVSGIVKLASPAMNDGFIYLPLKTTQSFLSAENLLSSVSLQLRDPSSMKILVNELQLKLGHEYEAMDWEMMMPEISNHIKADGVSFYVFSGVLYLIIGFGFFGTILMMIAERRKEFGMLISIGMKKSWLGLMLFGETLLITALGILLGMGLSFPLVVYLNKNPLVFTGEMAKAYEEFGFEPIIPTAISLNIFLSQSVVVMCLAFIIGIYPLWHIQKLDGIKALRN